MEQGDSPREFRGADRLGGPLGWVVSGCVAVALSLFLVRAAVEVTISPRSIWNERSLAPAFVVARGETLYPPRDGGPLLSCIYAPLSAVAYLPATLGRDPVAAIRIGVALSVLFFLAPLALALWLRRWSWVSAALYLNLGVGSAAVSYSIFPIHADAPALGLAGLGAVCLVAGRGWRWSAAGGALLAMSALSKQNLAPLALLGPFLVWWREGWRGGAAAMAGATAAGAGVLLYSRAALGRWEDLYFNLVTVPVGAGFSERGLPEALRALGGDVVPALCVLGLCVFLLRRAGRMRDARGCRLDAGMMIAMAALLAPTSLAGYMKLGGYPNALAPAVYFSILAACFAGQEACSRSRGLALGLGGLAALAGVLALPVSIGNLRDWGGVATTWTHQAFEFERAHPGEVYFPANPLAALMTSGRVYHMDDGLYCRAVAGYVVSEEQLMRHLPERASRIACTPGGCEWLVRATGAALVGRLAPERVDELAQWEIFCLDRTDEKRDQRGR